MGNDIPGPIPRRDFIRTAAMGVIGASVGAGLPAIAHGRIRGANDRVVVASVGTNSRGDGLARAVARLQNAEVGYVCDVDTRVVAKTTEAVAGVQDRTPKGVGDFRRALEDPEVDAVILALPIHWHAPAAIMACAAGKHVYVEKPCSHNPREGELLIQAARKFDRVVQMGNQRRSLPVTIDAMNEMRGGVIGRVRYARSWFTRGRSGISPLAPGSVPSWLDYDLWQGPAPRRPYMDNLIHYNWHWYWHWGAGEAGNNGIHMIDLCRWGLGADYPVRVAAIGGRFFLHDEAETPDAQMLSFEFENGTFMTWEGLSASRHGMQGSGSGVSFVGEEGALVVQGNGYRVLDGDNNVVKEVTAQNAREVADVDGRVLNSTDAHLLDFVDAIRENRRPSSEIEEGHKSTLLCHLANISYRLGRIVHCDGHNGHIRGDDEAAALWGREYEPGWEPSV
jgi:predicted dehydrogenase